MTKLEKQLYEALQDALSLLRSYEISFPYAELKEDEDKLIRIEKAIAMAGGKYRGRYGRRAL